jgi:stage II sporulation protein D
MRSPVAIPLCLTAIAAVLLSAASCGHRDFGRRETRGIPAALDVRDVRVLLVDRQPRCRVQIDRPFAIRSADGELVLQRDRIDWTVIGADGAGRVVFGNRVLGEGPFALSCRRADDSVRLARATDRGWELPHRYPGKLHLSATGRDRLRVINEVNLDTYVACVLTAELFPHFEREAYRAQAVAVRTYALYNMADRGRRPYDVDASQASQVYQGLPTGAAADRAREAANYSRGIVATWTSPAGERIFCTFYSSCCGGRTQNVKHVKPRMPAVPPLTGGVRCDCLSVARGPKYRWPPVRLSKSEVTARLFARYPEMKRLGRIEQLRVTERTKWGRPVTFQLIGTNGLREELPAEDFRLAVGSTTLRSTDCDVTDDGAYFVFTNGKGFGHGMGMCQWGMQAMALRGHRASDILKHYYPGAHLTRAY